MTTNMIYVAPGDLFNDTLGMLYRSIYDINILPGNNKLINYAKKLSNLIDVFNKMDICLDNTCSYDINSMILRNTDTKNCDSDILEGNEIDKLNYKRSAIDYINSPNVFLENITDHMLNNITVKKLCEIINILLIPTPILDTNVHDLDDEISL